LTLGQFALLRFLPLPQNRQAHGALQRKDCNEDHQRPQAALEAAAG
jgi:hypothetical protein